MKSIEPMFTKQAVVLLHKKYLQLIKIHDITVQLSDALNRNDDVSAQMYINMRQDSMLEVDEIEGQIHQLIFRMPDEWQSRMMQLTSRHWKDLHIEDDEEAKVGEEVDKIMRQLDRTIAIDRVLNKRIGGRDSYYQD